MDVSLSALGLVALAPLFAVLALLIMLGDGGPVFFRQARAGCRGKPFTIWKFRTMSPDAVDRGPPLTVGDDPRVTPVGRWLRRWKVDELPQLWNVLRGDMSLVGPRPEVSRYVAAYTSGERRVLDLTPGLTDVASIVYRNEEALLATAEDPERVYVDVVVPVKIALNLRYAAHATVWSDVVVVLRTLLAVVRPASSPPPSSRPKSRERASSSVR
jgi:lipopolysaccharide/colanic/teichoic acid biosynthesis glycosyltransferase